MRMAVAGLVCARSNDRLRWRAILETVEGERVISRAMALQCMPSAWRAATRSRSC
ncbi:hypothetical protein BS35_006784 [Actinomadura glauciflava]|nr:hypothetical protein [Actinomadura glauciflava]